MKRLTLVRHGKSSWEDAQLADHDRPLASRGRRDSKRMAALALEHLPPLDQILSSSAVRATATAKAFAQQQPSVSVHHDAKLYLATPSQLLRRLRALPDEAAHVLVVGHHPGLTELALRLVPDSAQWLPCKTHDAEQNATPTLTTAAVLSLVFPAKSWRDITSTGASFDSLLLPSQGVLLSPTQPPLLAGLLSAMQTDFAAIAPVLQRRREPTPAAVHLLRTRIKRLRAALHLLRSTFTDKAWRQRNVGLSLLAKRYAPLREFDVRTKLLMTDADVTARQRAARERTRLWRQTLPATVVTEAQAMLLALRDELRDWSETALANQQLMAELAHSYRRTRKLWRHVNADDDAQLHKCRIRSKRLFLQIELLQAGLLQTEQLASTSRLAMRKLQKLIELLGEQHDAVQLLASELTATERKLLQSIAANRAKRATKLGAALFAERHADWLAMR